MRIEVSLQPKQMEAHEHIEDQSSATYLFYGGAKGGGKSHLDRENEYVRRMKYPRTRGVIIRKTYEELYENHIQPMFRDHPETYDWFNASHKEIKYPSGSTTAFRYLARPSDVYGFQGIEYDDIKLDEGTQHPEEVFKVLKTSLRSNPDVIDALNRNGLKFKRSFLITGNPGGIGHGWVKRLFIDRDFTPREKPEDYAFIQARVYDNPLLIDANPEYLQNLYDLPDDLRRAYLDGDWDVFAGQFFTEFRRDRIVVEPFPIPGDWPVWGGLDWGYDPHPFVIGWYTMDVDGERGPKGKIYKIREAQGWKHTPEQVGMIMQKYEPVISFAGDSQMWTQNPYVRRSNKATVGAGQAYTDRSIADTIKALGVPLVQANKDRINGWINMRSMMQWTHVDAMSRGVVECEPKFGIFSTCVNTIKTIPVQVHSTSRPGDMEKQDGDDWCDETRYALMHIARDVERHKKRRVRGIVTGGDKLLFEACDMDRIEVDIYTPEQNCGELDG